MEPGESPVPTAFCELKEEVGGNKAEVITEMQTVTRLKTKRHHQTAEKYHEFSHR